MKTLYYAHQHGSGHCKNSEYFGKVLGVDLTVITSSDYEFNALKNVVRIKPEHERKQDLMSGRAMLPNYLHYSPVGNSYITDRSYNILKIAVKEHIQLAIVDLSVEVASLLRVSSVPFAYVRLPGNREDIPHLEAYRSALFLLAYYPKELEDPDTPDWIANKTIYLGFLIDAIPKETKEILIPEIIINNKDRLVTVVKGFGGSDDVDEAFLQVKAKHPEFFYLSIGPVNQKVKEAYDYIIEFTPSVHNYLSISQRIIAPASLNLTAEVLQQHKPFTVVGCDRPFDEQKQMENNLIRMGYSDSIETGLKTDFKVYKPKNESSLFLNYLKEANSIREFYYEFIQPKLNEK